MLIGIVHLRGYFFFTPIKPLQKRIKKVNELKKNKQKAVFKVFELPLKLYFSYSDAAVRVLTTGCVCTFNQWRLNGWLVLWQIGYLFPPWYFTQYLHELAAVYRDRESSWQDGCVWEREGRRTNRPTLEQFRNDLLLAWIFFEPEKTTQVCMRWISLKALRNLWTIASGCPPSPL